MKWKTMNLQTRLYLISAIIFLGGLGSSIWIYLASGNDSETALGYEIAGGNAYPIMPENSKMYMHDLELMGGKWAVIADELRRWFIGLWHGKSLAFTVVFISGFISFGLFMAARAALSGLETAAHNENRIKSK